MTGGCFGPVLVRFLSIRRPAAAERDLHTENGGAGESSRRWERERDPRDEKGSTGESCEALRRMARLRGCCARGIKRKRERERENGGSHAGRMTGLLRRGEESGGYDRRRVQIITIIIFPGNMAAERGWPPGIRVGGKREGERERGRKAARRRQGGLS